TGSLTLTSGAAFNAEIGGAASGQFDQANVTGSVALGGATLNVGAFGGFTPAAGNEFILINNDGSDAISGTFNGLAQGATLPNFLGSGLTARITYKGGDGNDVAVIVDGPIVYSIPSGNGADTIRLILDAAGTNLQIFDNGVLVDSRTLAGVTTVTI